MIWLWLTAAFAQDPQMCEVTHSADIDALLVRFDLAMTTTAIDRAREATRRLHQRLPCLEEVAKPTQIGRYARDRALLAFMNQDDEEVLAWSQLAQAAAPQLPWPPYVVAEHPLRQVLSDQLEASTAGPPGKGLVAPRKGGVFINGSSIGVPVATDGVFNLLQVADKSGLSSGRWIEGGAFPEDVLGPPGPALTAPKWFEPEDIAGTVAMLQASWGQGSEPAPAGASEPRTKTTHRTFTLLRRGVTEAGLIGTLGAGAPQQDPGHAGFIPKRAGLRPALGAASWGSQPLGPVNAAWQLALPAQLGGAKGLEAYAGVGLGADMRFTLAVGTSVIQVVEGDTSRMVPLWQPELGFYDRLSVGERELLVDLGAGWTPQAMHLRGRALIDLGPMLVGLDALRARAVFVDPSLSGREVVIGRGQLAVCAGVSLR